MYIYLKIKFIVFVVNMWLIFILDLIIYECVELILNICNWFKNN